MKYLCVCMDFTKNSFGFYTTSMRADIININHKSYTERCSSTGKHYASLYTSSCCRSDQLLAGHLQGGASVWDKRHNRHRRILHLLFSWCFLVLDQRERALRTCTPCPRSGNLQTPKFRVPAGLAPKITACTGAA